MGLIKCLAEYTKIKLSKKQTALLAYKIEKINLKESTGLQDHLYAAYGGFSKIIYKKKSFKISKITNNVKTKKNIENNLILFIHIKIELHITLKRKSLII